MYHRGESTPYRVVLSNNRHTPRRRKRARMSTNVPRCRYVVTNRHSPVFTHAPESVRRLNAWTRRGTVRVVSCYRVILLRFVIVSYTVYFFFLLSASSVLRRAHVFDNSNGLVVVQVRLFILLHYNHYDWIVVNYAVPTYAGGTSTAAPWLPRVAAAVCEFVL